MSQILDMARQREEILRLMLEKLKEKGAMYPEGSLRIAARRGKPQYYFRSQESERTGKYISGRDAAGIKALAQKGYEKRVIRSAEKELRALTELIEGMPEITAEEIFPALLPERQKLVMPVSQTDEMFADQWNSEQYEGLGFKDNFPELLTDRGERVRSKTEVIIANQMNKEGIMYKYERPLLLNGFGTVHPDFTALNLQKRKEYYWEHLGMMDDPEYAAGAVRKISAYIKSGIIPGDNLIITMETQNVPLSIRDIRILIDHFLR